jgi:glycosyltransferase involved in cell wall biosynthesis
MDEINKNQWCFGDVSVAVVMITLNEAHTIKDALLNVKGWASEVFIVDSCSTDDTVDIALSSGATVIQRNFTGFGNQWNFALENLPIKSQWVMKLDPDERISSELKNSIKMLTLEDNIFGINVKRRLWFMGEPLPINQIITRVWRKGSCRFSDVLVNEHPIVKGYICDAQGYLEHYDSPDLDHWLVKQNRYTTFEAVSQYQGINFSATPLLFGTKIERRMWIKKNFWVIPFRFQMLYFYHFIILGAWRLGKVGHIWSHLRVEVYRLWEFKFFEIKKMERLPIKIPNQPGSPDSRVMFYKNSELEN